VTLVLSIVLLIGATGDREQGIIIGIAIAFLLFNTVFAFYFLAKKWMVNLIAGAVVTMISMGVTGQLIYSGVKIPGDFYGFFTGLLEYALISIVCWEIIYRIMDKK